MAHRATPTTASRPRTPGSRGATPPSTEVSNLDADTVGDRLTQGPVGPADGPADPDALRAVQDEAAAELDDGPEGGPAPAEDGPTGPAQGGPAGQGPGPTGHETEEPREPCDPNDVAVVARTALGLVALALKRIEPRPAGAPPDSAPSIVRVAAARFGALLHERAPIIGAGLAMKAEGAGLGGRVGWMIAAAVAGLFDPYAPEPAPSSRGVTP
jgi:hypothetical protein